MKARIDTKAKTLAIEEEVSMDDLMKFAKFVGGDNWKEWKVQTNVRLGFTSSPVIVNPWITPRPYWYEGAYCGSTIDACGSLLTTSAGAMGTIGATHAQSAAHIHYVDFQTNN